MRKIRASIQIILCAALLTGVGGCSKVQLERPTLEDLGLISVIGFDYLDDKHLKMFAAIPQSSQGKKNKTQIFNATASIPHQALMRLSSMSEKTVTMAQMRVVLFSEAFARKKGLKDTMISLYRDPLIGDNVFIGIVEGTVEELMNARYKNTEELGVFLNDVLHPRRETSFQPHSTLHDFMFHTTAETSDPVVPFLKRSEGSIQIAYGVILKNGKMVDVLKQDEGKLIVPLFGITQPPSIELSIADEKEPDGRAEAIIDYISAKCRITVSGDLQRPVFQIKMSMKGNLLAYTGSKDLENPDQMNAVQEQLEKEMEKSLTKTLIRMQKKSLDPVGFGEYLRSKYDGKWSREKGDDYLANAVFNTRVALKLIRYGTISGKK
ncbi:Ger(x)C family spore germination protein [Brevibacillus fluminis]|uniref:Ger(x)C family spore germination protein n=1 Tax=Brevibacillus fluminis TaxID=511487 RepID=UPI003F89BA13